MKQLIDIKSNIFYQKEGKKYNKVYEIVLITASSEYSYVINENNKDGVKKEVALESNRIIMSAERLEEVGKHLILLSKLTEKDLE